MFGGNNGNRFFPNETQFQHQTNASNQLQLFGNLQAGYSVEPVNYFGNEHGSSMNQPNKRSKEMEDISKQRLQIYNVNQKDADRLASIQNPNTLPTGLRLSYDNYEHNSSVTPASGSMTATPSIILSLGDNIRTELDRQQEELDQYINLQKEQLSKGVREMKQKHITALLASVEKGICAKLRERDVEIENMNRNNRELAERIKQVAIEVQSWQCRAKYNESVVNTIKQAISQRAEHWKEGFGESEVNDDASYIDPNNFLNIPGAPINSTHKSYQDAENLTCRACKAKAVSMLLMPCRHLCLCKDCEGFINVCPVCQWIKTASVEVYLS